MVTLVSFILFIALIFLFLSIILIVDILKKNFIYNIFLLIVFLFVHSCANRGSGPQGGPKDEIPPKLVRSKPAANTVNFTGKSIELEFDEYLQVQDIFKNIVISPPQKKAPVIKAIGKKIVIQFSDSLQSNTTYTIDFGNAIADNNEKNVLENFSFAFSTGDVIDSLFIVGTLLDAQSLNPVESAIVGIYDNLSDTAFTKTPFLRITKTNENGEFAIKNAKEGDYHIFALSDQNSNYYFDQPAESIAFLDAVVNPIASFKFPTRQDTLQTDTMQPDAAIKVEKENPFDKLILHQFQEEYHNQYFIKGERKEKEKFTLYFNAPLEKYPTIEPLNFKFENNYLVQNSEKNDTLIYWLTDENLLQTDTMKFILHYPKTDSIGNLISTQDTLKLDIRKEIKQQQQQSNRRAKKEEKEKETIIDYFTYTTNATGTLEYYDLPVFKFDSPAKNVDRGKIRLQHKVDTLWKDMPYEFVKIDNIGMKYELSADFDAGENYRIELDSAAITNIYEKTTEEKSFNFKVRQLEEYSTLIINVKPYDERIIVQLLNNKDVVLMQEKTDKEGVIFDYLNPGVYYLKLFFDENGNEKWDTGKYSEKRQPEKVYYFNKQLGLRANWEVEEDWDYTSSPVLTQKPTEIIIKSKNK